MKPYSPVRGLTAILFLALIALTCPKIASAQQVTYYTFDNTTGSFSYSCEDPAANSEADNPLLCLNNGSGDVGATPALVAGNSQTATGEHCGVGDTRCPYSDSGYHTAMVMTTQGGGERSSVWFSVPQKVRDGFTSYFAFRFLPTNASYATADGLTFVVQNAKGIAGSGAGVSGSGPNVVGQAGGGIGYDGIDQSLAVELDTYTNPQFADPVFGAFGQDQNSNHIAVQSCGSGINSANHGSGGCLVGSVNSALPVTMSDGHIHEVVIEYTGAPVDQSTPNLFVYIDPTFVSGTHTPVANSTKTISTNVDLSTLGLLPSSCGVECESFDSAYVGFTSATGGAFEGHNLLAWTFTPHTPVTQQQPLKTDGTTTTFPFGDHTAGITYPANVDTSEIDMIVTAHTVSPGDFTLLVAGGPYANSHCQVYDGTGGNCVIYSVACVHHSDQSPVACPVPSDPNAFVTFKTAYENTIQPLSPGFLQGDPLRSVITNISGDGTTATVTCEGECPVTVNQAVTIVGNTNNGFNGATSVISTPTTNSFTFASAISGSGTGGYLTSKNLQDICDPNNCYVPQRIDGTTTGRTKNFSDFVATAVTPVAFTSAPTLTALVGSPVNFPLTATGVPAPTFSIDLGTLPSGLQLVSGVISGTPAANSGGVYNLTLRAHNGVAPDATQSFQVIVNAAPVISSTDHAAFTAGTPGSFAVVATGYPVPVIGISGGSLPAGVSLSPAGVLSSTASAAAGTYLFTIGATNANGTVTQAFTLVISPATAQLKVTPTSSNFGDVYLGNKSTNTFKLTNTGTTPLNITKISFIYGTGPSRTNYGYKTECGGTLKAGKVCTIDVTLHAQDVGPGASQLAIAFNLPGSPILLNLSGNVINPKAKLSTSSLSFGTQSVNSSTTKTVVLTSNGDTPLLINGISVQGSSDFTQTSNCPASLAKNATCTITVKFKPTAKTSRTGTLRISDNAQSSPQTVSLTGKGN